MYMPGAAQVHNSYNATRVLFNPDIKEVRLFIAKNWYSFFSLISTLSSSVQWNSIGIFEFFLMQCYNVLIYIVIGPEIL